MGNNRNFRNDRNERNDRNDRNRFQEPQRNEFEEPNQNVRHEIRNNAKGLDNIMNMIEQTYGPNLQRAARSTFRRPYPDRVERDMRDQGITKFLTSLHFLEMMKKQHMSTFLGLQSNVERYQTMGMKNL